jgi:hypothetical protein
MTKTRIAGMLPIAAVFLSFLVVASFVLLPAALSPGALAGGDWTDLLYPFYRFTHETFAREGRLPFWNPYIFSGMPHLASLNVLAFYPTELLSLFTSLDAPAFYALDLILHLAVAGTGMFWWMRRSGRSAPAALAAGLCYGFGGHLFSLAGAGHAHWVRSMAFLPFVFALLEEGSRESGARTGWYAAAGAMLALPVLTSALHFLVLGFSVCAAWILFTGRGGPATRLVRAGAVIGAAVALGAVVLVPGWEYYGNSVRSSAGSWATGMEWALFPWDLAAIPFPEIWGTVGPYFGPHPFRASTDYPGLVPLALALTGVVVTLRREPRWLILAVAGILLAFGPATPVGVLLARVPVFSGLRVPLRWLSFVHLAACVLVAYGFEAVMGRNTGAVAVPGRAKRFMWPAVIMAIWAAIAVALATGNTADGIAGRLVCQPFAVAHLIKEAIPEGEARGVVKTALAKGAITAVVATLALGLLAASRVPAIIRVGAVLAVVTADLLVSTAGYFVFAPAPARDDGDRVARWLAGKSGRDGVFRSVSDEYFGMPNRRMGFGLEWTAGYHGLPPARYYRLQASAVSAHTFARLSLLNVAYIVTGGPPPEGLKVEAKIDGPDGPVSIVGNPAVLPRAFLAGGVIPCRDLDEALAVMDRDDWTPRLVPVDPVSAAASVPGRLAANGAIAVEYGRDEIGARVDIPGKEPGLVVFSETWYPAWKIFVDGARAPLLRACGALRAVSVASGAHAVRMIYDSVSFKIGLWVSSASVAVLIAGLLL